MKEHKKQNAIILDTGDSNIDISIKLHIFILKCLRKIGTQVQNMGNHDLEGGNYWAKAIKKAKPNLSFLSIKPKLKFVSANLSFSRKNPLEKHVQKSTIIKTKNKKGIQKIGVIGVSPFDYKKLAFITPYNNYVDVMNLEETIEVVTQEAQKLKLKNVDVIGVLAHTGEKSPTEVKYYEKFAEIDGVNFVLGGHDHKELDAWYKAKDGRNVKIVSLGASPGKNIIGEGLDSFGKLRLVFDYTNNLVPDKCQNKVELTENYPISKKIERLEDKYLKPNKVISYSINDFSRNYTLSAENPMGSLSADSMLWIINKETKGEKAQIAFVNSGTIRNSFHKGNITIGDIRQAFPFTASTLIKTKLTKSQIINTLNWGVESTNLPKVSPGVMQVGGMRYTIGKNGKVKDVYLLKKDGSLGERIDIQPDNKEYTVIYDNFLMTGVAGLSELKKSPESMGIEYFPYSRQDALIEYLKHNYPKKPIEIKTVRIERET